MRFPDLKSKLKLLWPLKKIQEALVFIKNVANDPRIPENDKKALLALVALIVSPFDLIPDWIPVFGQIDDAVMLALILDYLFEVLDEEILLTHYPWGPESFKKIKRVAGMVSRVAPDFIKKRLWSYTR